MQKKRKSDTSTVFTPGAKRQKQKDNAENIIDTSTLQHQPLPLMVLPPIAPTAMKKQGERKKKYKWRRVEKEQDDTNSKGSDTNDDDDDSDFHVTEEGDESCGESPEMSLDLPNLPSRNLLATEALSPELRISP